MSGASHPDDIDGYERGLRVPVWMLLRDLAIPRDRLSRALRSLARAGMVLLYGADLDALDADPLLCICRNAKFAALSAKGEQWLKSQQSLENQMSKTLSGGCSANLCERRWTCP
jgi:hypothetical protein